MTFDSDVQKSNPGNLVELFDLDCTPLGGEVHRFVRGTDNGQIITWRGNVYSPRDFETTGWEITGEGKLPRPHITLSHVNSTLLALVNDSDDLLGAVVTRWRTFVQFLDNGEQANADAHFPPDVFVINRKVSQGKAGIEWELAAAMDQEDVKLPRRQILRDLCMKQYRVWDENSKEFIYTDATRGPGCPYTGGDYYNALGESCSASEDQCGKRPSDCKLRFGEYAPLPYGGFPGVARTRTS